MKTIKLRISYEEIIGKIKNIAKIRNLEISMIDINHGYIELIKSTSILSWGETITIIIKKDNAGYIVTVTSHSKQLITWGVNDDNEQMIINDLQI